jgi:membrane protein
MLKKKTRKPIKNRARQKRSKQNLDDSSGDKEERKYPNLNAQMIFDKFKSKYEEPNLGLKIGALLAFFLVVFLILAEFDWGECGSLIIECISILVIGAIVIFLNDKNHRIPNVCLFIGMVWVLFKLDFALHQCPSLMNVCRDIIHGLPKGIKDFLIDFYHTSLIGIKYAYVNLLFFLLFTISVIDFYFATFEDKVKLKANQDIDEVIQKALKGNNKFEVTEHSIDLILNSSDEIEDDMITEIKNSTVLQIITKLAVFLLGLYFGEKKGSYIAAIDKLNESGEVVYFFENMILLCDMALILFILMFYINKCSNRKANLYKEVLKDKKLNFARVKDECNK